MATKNSKPASRDGQKFIGGYFSPAVWKAMKTLSVNEDTTVQRLMAEAIQKLLDSRGIDLQVKADEGAE
jgi:hypothetical protein